MTPNMNSMYRVPNLHTHVISANLSMNTPFRATARNVFFVTRLKLNDVMHMAAKSNMEILALRARFGTGELRAQIVDRMQYV